VSLINQFPSIRECIDFTNKKLKEIEKELASVDLNGSSLIANGSYARKEASAQSDFDYVLITPRETSENDCKSLADKVEKIVKNVIGKPPSADGAFAVPIKVGSLTKDIGGSQDTNETITRRILFLTEGLPIGDPTLFERQKSELIERYIQDIITDHQLALFFLNDVIRYWRTICVDFENKTFERGKDWGIRNIKLVFSRRLLYFGGILIAAETAQRTLNEKRRICSELMSLTAIERTIKICGPAAERALKEYDYFLSRMKDGSLRSSLAKVDRDRTTHNEDFKDMKNQAHYFTYHLISLLQTTYSVYHPIHKSLIM
jgi:hypothetical protein